MTRVLRVVARNPGPYTLEGTNTWIVGEAPAIVIDPGPADVEHVRAVVRLAGEVGLILVTHDHPDHAPGASLIAGETGAPVLARNAGAGTVQLMPDQVVNAGGAGLRVVLAPGHSPDHVVFHDTATATIFTGDAVLGRGTSVVDPPEGNMAEYMGSLASMLELAPRVLYPGHGPIVEDGTAKLEEYLEHRRLREAQILAGVRDRGGPCSPAELVPQIYAGYPAVVLGAAGRSVLAHLLKLEGEGLVTRVDDQGDRFIA